MRALFFWICAVVVGFFPATLRAQPEPVTRVLRTFDFEERRLNNPEDLPMHWQKVEGPNLPHYVNGMLSTDRARSGRYSFRFDLNGGGLIYRYPAKLIGVHAGAHYRVHGFVQTTPLANARARITAYFVDQDGRAIAGSTRHSSLYAASSDVAEWSELEVELSAEDAAARWLVIELSLLQPMHHAPSTLGQRTLFTQDIRGSAWFDDVTVSQVPRVTLRTEHPGNIFRRSDTPCLHVLVNDRVVDDLAAQLVITNAEKQVVHQRSGALDMSAAAEVAPGERKLTLPLPPLEPGWYSATLVMISQGQFLGRRQIDLILLPDDTAAGVGDPRFGIVATDLPFEAWRELPQILACLGAGRVKLSVWSERGDVQQMDSSRFDNLLEHLSALGIEPTACLLDLPPAMREKLDGGSWEALLKCDPALWQPQLAYLIARHANHLHRWQLGDDGSDVFVLHPGMRQVYKLVYDEFARLMGNPDLAMPWPAWYELDGEQPATVALHVKPDVLPAQLPLYVQDLRNQLEQNLSIYLEPLDRSQYGREVQIRDFAQRIIFALASDVSRIDVRLPFSVSRDAANPTGSAAQTQPQEMFIIVRTVITTLAGATYRGRMPLDEGIEAFLFDRNGVGILVLWDRGTGGRVRQLGIHLGQGATRIDLWGNATPLLRSRHDGHGEGVKIDVGPMPIFLVDVDGPLAQLRASVALDNPLLESSFKPHTRKLRFVNPYRQSISGSFKLIPPAGWVINPPTGNFSLNPDEVLEREITLEFPYNSFAGPRTIVAQFNLQADNNSSFGVPIVVKLGLSDVGMQTLALRDGHDVIVQQIITNYGDRPINYTAFAIYPGQARQERLVTDLGPGRTTIKKYRFANIRPDAAAKVRSGLRELVGTRILNDEVAIQ